MCDGVWAEDAAWEDRAWVAEQVAEDGFALLHAATELRDDRALVLAAVEQSGAVLEHVAAQHQADEEVVLTAVKSGADALDFAAESLLTNGEFTLRAIEANADSLAYFIEYFSPSFAADVDGAFCVVAVGISGRRDCASHAAAYVRAHATPPPTLPQRTCTLSGARRGSNGRPRAGLR